MSKYTTQVRFICESYSGLRESAGYNDVNEVINRAIPKVFDFEFPIFDESYRNVLCKKILKHYYTREICEETVGLWKLRLDARLNEIMPYFNKLYKSELLEFNPLYDVDITRTSSRENESKNNDEFERTGSESNSNTVDHTKSSTTGVINSSTLEETNKSTSEGENTSSQTQKTVHSASTEIDSTVTGTSNGSVVTDRTVDKTERDLYSDTPQGALTNVENETYLTNARKKIGNEELGEESRTNGNTSNVTDSTESTTVNDEITTNISGSASGNTSGEISREFIENNDTQHSENARAETIGNVSSKVNGKENKSINSTEEFLESVKGKQSGVSYSKLIMEFRDTFLNIDMQIINNLSDLFFGLW